MQRIFLQRVPRPIRWGLIIILLLSGITIPTLHTFASSLATDRPWMNTALTQDQRAGSGVSVQYAEGTNPDGSLPALQTRYLTPASGGGSL